MIVCHSSIIFLKGKSINLIITANPTALGTTAKKLVIDETFSTESPISLYGFSKLSSEILIKEYSFLYNMKYLINRFGVVSGYGQFGKQDQGFLSMWLWRHLNKLKINYQGFGGYGNQVRDVLDINDLCLLVKDVPQPHFACAIGFSK